MTVILIVPPAIDAPKVPGDYVRHVVGLLGRGAGVRGDTRLRELGFETLGHNDFAHRWKDNNVTPETVIAFVDRVQSMLKGTGVLMQFTTVA